MKRKRKKCPFVPTDTTSYLTKTLVSVRLLILATRRIPSKMARLTMKRSLKT